MTDLAIERIQESIATDASVDVRLRALAGRWLAVDAAFNRWCGGMKWALGRGAISATEMPHFPRMATELVELDDAITAAWQRYESSKTDELLAALLVRGEAAISMRLRVMTFPNQRT